jgi:hypothetical protein
MLIAMLVTWVTVGKPHYASMDTGQKIAYVSFMKNPRSHELIGVL